MEKSIFIEKIDSFIKKEHLFCSDSRYLLAVSGGADSVVMLRALLSLGIDCAVAHCNFHLRGEESNRDARFVEALCSRLGVKLFSIDFDVPAYQVEHHMSLEMACRKLRYNWFTEIISEHGFEAVVVAHHSDDNIETLFLNLIRGTGIAGTTGMQPSGYNGCRVLRPMLCVSRAEIEAYAALIGQDFVTDSTNRENDVKRNRLRNVILPALREYFPDADKGLLRTIDNLRQCERLYRTNIIEVASHHLDVEQSDITVIHLSEFINRYIDEGCAETMLFELISMYGFSPTQMPEIIDAYRSENQGTGKLFLTKNGEYEAVLSRGNLEIAKCFVSNDEIDIDLSQHIDYPENIAVKMCDGASFSPKGIDGKSTVCFSSEILTSHLTLRHWREGDRIRPFGMKGTRLVSDIFSDLKLSTIRKRRLWLLTADGQVLWILGIRSAALYPVTPATPRYLHLSYRNKSD